MSRARPDRTSGIRRDAARGDRPAGIPLRVETRTGRRGLSLPDGSSYHVPRGARRRGRREGLGIGSWPRRLDGRRRWLVWPVLALVLLLIAALLVAAVSVADEPLPRRAPYSPGSLSVPLRPRIERDAPDRASRSRRLSGAAAPFGVHRPLVPCRERPPGVGDRAVRRCARELEPYFARFLRCTRGHESDTSGGYRAVSPSGTYRGAYQMDDGTWGSVGGSGSADAAPLREQDERAIILAARRGAQPWGGRCALLLPPYVVRRLLFGTGRRDA